jgi:hypothetical protein
LKKRNPNVVWDINELGSTSMTKKQQTPLTKEEMLEALERSGYLLESEITRLLASNGYFVESNQVINDPVSNKSREIDLMAERDSFGKHDTNLKLATKVRYIFEIKNNLFPLILLTRQNWSPNTDNYESLKLIITTPTDVRYDDYISGYFAHLLQNETDIFTQYCSFNPKKSEKDVLMAMHPEPLYSGLQKITQYCEDSIDMWNERDVTDEYFRNFLMLPILLIKDNLFELYIDKRGKQKLVPKEVSRLVFNYQYKDENRSSIVYVITKKGLMPFIKKMQTIEDQVRAEMTKLKTGAA